MSGMGEIEGFLGEVVEARRQARTVRLHVKGYAGSVLYNRLWALDDEGRAWTAQAEFGLDACKINTPDLTWKRVAPSKAPKYLQEMETEHTIEVTV